MMDTSKATPELFESLAKAQAEVENASKNSANPHFKSRYADLAEVLNTVRPVFAAHGLSLLQSTGFDGALVNVTTVVGHKAGGYVSSTASCVPGRTDAQGIGAATTYLRRYSLAAMCGVAQEDDDGNAAAHNGKPQAARKVDELPKPKPPTEDELAKAQEFASAIDDATSAQQLQELGPGITKLHPDCRAALRGPYSDKLKALKESEA